MRNRVITMCNSEYFQYGSLFLSTRKRVNADFILYGPDLTTEQVDILRSHNIEYRKIDLVEFNTKMQMLKFKFLYDNIVDNGYRTGLAFVDFDTAFLMDIGPVFNEVFDIGVTVRNEFKSKPMMSRAYSNGGVIFCMDGARSRELCGWAIDVMVKGGDDLLPDYGKMFDILEAESRPKNKRWFRNNLRWWVDQVFLSSLVSDYYSRCGRKNISDRVYSKVNDFNICFLNCDKYNRLDPTPDQVWKLKDVFIIHLKRGGRDNLWAYRRIIG